MRMLLIGPPGAGKGTYARDMSKKFSIPVVTPGDLIREHIKRKTKFGKKAAPIVKKGGLLPHKMVDELIKEVVQNKKYKAGFILDGYPRTIEQVRAFDKLSKFDVVLDFKIPAKSILKRLASRRICQKCKRVYHLITLRPKKQGICDSCGSKLIQRDDDKQNVIKDRILIYNKNIKLVLNYYKKQKLVIDVDADQSIAAVLREIYRKLRTR